MRAWLYARCIAPLVDRDILAHLLMRHHVFGGDISRVHLSPTASLMNALLNVSSGEIWIEDNVFLGHNVCLITGSHDPNLRGGERKENWAEGGRDIIVREGVWIASNVTVIGPSEIGAHSVIAAGAVVHGNIPARVLAGGVPAQIIKEI